jgi:zinc protease
MANSIPEFQQKELKNGLQILVVPLKNGSGVINTNIVYQVGSRNEIMGKSGIAHMLEHLNFKSTKNMEAGEFDEIVKGFGGLNNASTSFDITNYFIKSSAQNLDKSLELFADMMENLSLKDEEFQPERDVVLEERYWRTDNSPFGLLYFTLFNNAFVYHPYHWTPIGFINDIQNWKIEDIRDFWETYYQPKNAFVIVTGDVEADEVFQKVEKWFGKIENKREIPTRKYSEPKQLGAKRIYINKDTEVEYFALGFKIPDFRHQDQTELSIISELFSSGRSSRLYKKLVIEKKLVSTIYSYPMDSMDENLFMFLAVGNGGVSAEEIEKEIWIEIEKLKNELVSEKEFEKVKTNVKSDFIYSFEKSMETAQIFAQYFGKGDLEPLLKYEESVMKSSTEKIREVAKKYFVKEQSTTVIYKK